MPYTIPIITDIITNHIPSSENHQLPKLEPVKNPVDINIFIPNFSHGIIPITIIINVNANKANTIFLFCVNSTTPSSPDLLPINASLACSISKSESMLSFLF